TQCLRPTNYFVVSELIATSGDCNDAVATINPAATEICDGIDNDCNGSTDEGVQTTYYRDMDGDGFGNLSNTTMACSLPTGYVTNSTDCDDNDALEKPGQTWYADADNDGYSTGIFLVQCLRPAGFKGATELTATIGDCNDSNAAINPAATEVCDGVDNNCDGQIDNGVLNTYYRDMDGDGFGNPSNTTMACSIPTGYVVNNTDCDDNDALEKPGQVWYADVDNDGYSTGATLTQCLRPTGYKVAAELTATTGDCNDNAAAINPAATEVCDGIDNNCNGSTDEGVQTTYYRDMDSDGFGNPSNTTLACSLPSGYVTNNTDCDDNDALEKPGQVWYADVDNDGYSSGTTLTQCLRPAGYKVAAELTATTGDCNDNAAAINPAATEICDGIDNDCDGQIDDGVLNTFYRDLDGDGFGNPSNTTMACSQPIGYVSNNTDCDDNDALEKPGQVWFADVDNDGYSTGATLTQCLRPVGYKVAAELTSTMGDCNDNAPAINPAATEICDGVDNNCNGSTDEGVQTTYYLDMDGDGFGNPSNSTLACSLPSGYVINNTDCNDNSVLEKPGQVWYKDTDGDGYSNGATLTQCLRPVGYKVPAELTATTGDCNDNNAAIKPGALEICDGVDNDCDGATDEGVKTEYFADTDGDGFGDPNNTITECSQPQGYVTNSEDCNDTDDEVNPSEEEVCDDKDNDCNGVVDDIGGTTAGNWTSGDVGGANGGANFPPCNAEPADVFTINATGFSTSSSDKIQAVYQELCGNGEIIARVLNVQNGGWAGIMLRETLDPGSKKVSLKTQLTPSIRREIRSMTNGAASILNFNRPQHVWLRLTRSGSNFVGYTSTDGANWSFAFAATVSMNGCIYAGLFSESINASVTTIATFDNVSIIRETENLSRPGASFAASLDGQQPELSATIYPNPTEGRVTVRFTEMMENRATIRVFNALGELVISKQTTTMNAVTDHLDLSELPDGVYSIQIAVPGHTPLTKRIVLAKASGVRP
ncbi:MAG: MopE-related protein, partial [Saprospiraceae bacterium]